MESLLSRFHGSRPTTHNRPIQARAAPWSSIGEASAQKHSARDERVEERRCAETWKARDRLSVGFALVIESLLYFVDG
jgi:hypothetical protein